MSSNKKKLLKKVLKLHPKITKSTESVDFCSSMPVFSLADFEVAHWNLPVNWLFYPKNTHMRIARSLLFLCGGGEGGGCYLLQKTRQLNGFI